jgi:hypothetical protein
MGAGMGGNVGRRAGAGRRPRGGGRRCGIRRCGGRGGVRRGGIRRAGFGRAGVGRAGVGRDGGGRGSEAGGATPRGPARRRGRAPGGAVPLDPARPREHPPETLNSRASDGPLLPTPLVTLRAAAARRPLADPSPGVSCSHPPRAASRIGMPPARDEGRARIVPSLGLSARRFAPMWRWMRVPRQSGVVPGIVRRAGTSVRDEETAVSQPETEDSAGRVTPAASGRTAPPGRVLDPRPGGRGARGARGARGRPRRGGAPGGGSGGAAGRGGGRLARVVGSARRALRRQRRGAPRRPAVRR